MDMHSNKFLWNCGIDQFDGAYTFGSNDEEYIVPRAIEIIEQVARKFHLVIRKLSQRHDNRPPNVLRNTG